jgi:crotonobetainyl-CoA:carnitine CoA-transferase CaiB-like acyl-CoA transferase
MLAASGTLAALYEARATGRGRHVAISLLDAQLAWLGNRGSEVLVGGVEPERFGNAHPSICPYETFRASDGYVNLAVGTDGQFQRFCALAGLDDVATDVRFATNRDRVDNVEEIDRIVGDWVAHRPQEELVAILVEAEVAVAPVMNVADLVNDPQLAHRHTVVKVPDNELGEILMPDVQPKLSATPGAVRHPGPPLGHDTDEILRTRLGLDAAEIETLRTDKVV